MGTALSWLVGSVLMFLEFGVLGCSALGSKRRSRYFVRLGCASVLMSALALGLAFAMSYTELPQQVFGLLWMVLLLAAAAVPPVFCYHTLAGFRGPSDGDGGGGPGSGPPLPPQGPSPGGIPLPDADQARTRRRDHDRPSLAGSRPRRSAVEPAPRHAPAGPHRR